jgi:hypoxanthine phosphoribosyltransferase
VGFSIPNEFVVGFGLDYAERYRNLQGVAVLSLKAQDKPGKPEK